MFLESVRDRATITYDPNIRTTLLPSREESLDRFDRFIRLADVVKMSNEDAAWLLPDVEIDEVLDHLISRGAQLGVITLGERGALLASRAHRVSIPAVVTAIVDTIGAGDSYMSTLIFMLRDNALDSLSPELLREIGVRAGRASAITVSRAGADPPSLAELDALTVDAERPMNS
jgi:fructokinase